MNMTTRMVRTTDTAGRAVEMTEKAAAILARKPAAAVKVPAAAAPRPAPNLHPFCKPTPLPPTRTPPAGRVDQGRLY